jgi:hypothetical protein
LAVRVAPALARITRAIAARVRALPGRPHRKLTTGVRSGAARDPAIRAFRTALRQAIRSTTANRATGNGAVG